MVSRRELLKLSMGSTFFAFGPSLVAAERTIGAATLTSLSDGHLTLPGDFIFSSMPQKELAAILEEHGLSRDQLAPECNLALYRDGTNTVLFDVGSGPDFMSSAGKIKDSLETVGLLPEDITHVVFTHCHPDHIWGLLDDFDEPLFYEAQYMMGRTEWDYWWNPETVQQIGEARAAFAVGAKRRLETIEDSVVLFDDGDEIIPSISAVASPGHTPGHMSYEIRQGTDAYLVLGDAIGNHHVAFQRPEWESGSDQDAALAAKTRLALFDRIQSEQLGVLGFHLPGGGMGRVHKSSDGFVFVSDEA